MKFGKFFVMILISFIMIYEAKGITISGHVYEDVNGDGDLSDKQPIQNVSLRLYDSNGTLISSTSTNASGLYSFTVSQNKTYFIAVDSTTVSPSSGFNTGFSLNDVWAEQTYIKAPTNNTSSAKGLCDTDGSPTTPPTEVSGEKVCFGGAYGNRSDNFSSLNSSEHKVKVVVGTDDLSGIDFGFSFNVVTNVNDQDDDGSSNRTCQGCFRQFIQNANAISGGNTMRFVPAVLLNAGNWWKITLNTTLSTFNITDNHTTIDGTAYDFRDGVSIKDTNPGTIFRSGLSVGTGIDGIPNTGDEPTLPAYDKLELEIDLNNVNDGFFITGDNVTIKRIALVHTVDNGDTYGAINYNTGKSGVIEENIIGAHADGSVPTPDLRIYQGVRSDAQDLIIRNNFITDNIYRSLFLFENSIVENNYIYNSSTQYECGDSIEIRMSSTARQSIIRNNWIEKVAAYAIELPQNAGNTIIENNTILNTGKGNENGDLCSRGSEGYEEGAIRMTGENNQIIQNIIHNASTSGIIVVNTERGYPAKFTKISKNSIYQNGKISIDLDLTHDPAAGQNYPNGDGVSPNDGAKDTNKPNYGMDYPVFTTVEKVGTKLHVVGYVGTPSSKIAGTHTIELYKAEDDGNNNGEIILGDGKSIPHGEGKTYINACQTNADGTFDCSVNIPPVVTLSSGDKITATATDSNNNTSEFSADYTVALPTTLNGYVYEDKNHNSNRESGETGLSNVRVELWYYNGTNWTMETSTTTNSDGYYEFSPNNTGTYRIIEDALNIGTDQNKGSDPSEYISTTPNIVEINWDGTQNKIINFGDFHGSKVSGKVFNDSGDGTKTSSDAHNITFDSTEKGIQDVEIKACANTSCSTVIETTTTNANGEYTVWIPDSYNGTTVYIKEKDLNGYVSVGDYKEGAVDSNTKKPLTERNTLSYPMSSGEQKDNYNFADVPKLQITPDHSYLVSIGDSLSISHMINVKTPGEIALTLNSSENFVYTVFKDYDCDESPDGNQIIPDNNGFYTVDTLDTGKYCILIKTVVPTNTPSGTVEKLEITAYEDWTNTTGVNPETGLKYDDQDSVVDSITVNSSSEGMLRLEKWVRNVTTSGSFTKNNDAKPCEIIEYKIDFKNIGASNINQITFRDIIPEGTEIVQNVYNGSYNVKVVVGTNTYYGKTSETPDTDGVKIENGTLIIDLPKITGNAYKVLNAGKEGYFIYQVRLEGNCGTP